MIRRAYICTTSAPSWNVGQYFIVDEDREFCVPARAVQSGKAKFTLEAETMVELHFDNTIKPYVTEIGAVTDDDGDTDDDDSFIIA